MQNKFGSSQSCNAPPPAHYTGPRAPRPRGLGARAAQRAGSRCLYPIPRLCAATGGLNWVGVPGAAAGEWVGWAGGGEAEGEVWEVGLGWVSRVVRVGSMAQARAYSRSARWRTMGPSPVMVAYFQ